MSPRRPYRTDGFAPIGDYALVGDGRTAALIALDGGIDWLCLPDVDSPSVFARILDAERGGTFTLGPEEPFEAERRYVYATNLLDTTFRTATGTARVTDAMTLADETGLSPMRELVRRVVGVSGEVAFAWRVEPRFDYAQSGATLGRRGGRHVAFCGKHALALATWGAGEEQRADGAFAGRFVVRAGQSALLDLSASSGEPLVLAGRDDAERRLDRTARFWRRWSDRARYEGRWRDLVVRSALALKLLVYSPSGAVVAAPTTSLPEWIGGGRNWDYRFTWIRDAAFTVEALTQLGYDEDAEAFLWWLGHATALSHPELKVLYGVDGSFATDERELPLGGYRGSRPVRAGNAAAGQTQLDVYGAWFDSLWTYARATGALHATTGRSVAGIADWVAEHWRSADAGIWEVRSAQCHFVQSKAMCWVALDRACKLAERGLIPDRSRRWRAEADAIRRFVDDHGWDEDRRSYVRAPELRELDASLLTLSLFEFEDPGCARIQGTVDALRRELAEGPLVYRYRGTDGVEGEEGFFLTCSFWLAAALAKGGRVNEAIPLMDELAGLANDVGLYSEEIARDGTMLGNFPQGLVHLALINAALAVARAEGAR